VIPIDRNDIFRAIEFERERQDHLHPIPWNKSSGDKEVDAMANYINTTEMLAILVEEVGEVARALQGDSDLAEELTHVAAVCVRWLEHMKKSP
jgi:hypothetical protein